MTTQHEQKTDRQARLTRFCVRWSWWGVLLGSLTVWGLVVTAIMVAFWRP